jgi:hypothetical protein
VDLLSWETGVAATRPRQVRRGYPRAVRHNPIQFEK